MANWLWSKSRNRRLSEEKERHLQKRVGDLQVQVQQLERRMILVKTDNETLKRKYDDQKPPQEKIQILKKRNAELAAIARRLEEKAKHLQQQNLKKAKGDTSHDVEYLKKFFAKQRAKDFAEHARLILMKDREIENLRTKCQELADQLSNVDFPIPENIQVYEEKEELVNIIKQAAKERLQLERQITKNKVSKEAQQIIKNLEVTNEALKCKISHFEQTVDAKKNIEVELTQSRLDCQLLSKQIEEEQARSSDLGNVVKETFTKNTELKVQVSDLLCGLGELEGVIEECQTLKVKLGETQHEAENAREEVGVLQSKVQNLEVIAKNFEDSKKKRSLLEHEYQKSVQKLQQKQSEFEVLQTAQEDSKCDYKKTLKCLQDKILELNNKCQKQEDQHNILSKEFQVLQTSAGSRIPSLEVLDSENTVLNSMSNSCISPVSPSVSRSSPSHHSIQKYNGWNEQSIAEEKKTSLPGEVTVVNSNSSTSVDKDKGEDSGMESSKEQKSLPDNESCTSETMLAAHTRKGPIQVFIVKYSYDPYQHSPNENPDAELPVSSGDYVLVLGDMDEDGFYEGESIDGRRGLVPSNFIEKVADEDLADFHATVAGYNQHDGDSNANSLLQDLDFDSSEESEKPVVVSHKTPDSTDNQKLDPQNVLEDMFDSSIGDSPSQQHQIQEMDEDKGDLPYPKNLSLDRQLTNSIFISWCPPEGVSLEDVKTYNVYVDNQFKTMVQGGERTKALLEEVDSRHVHQVSVNCVTQWGISPQNHCTLVVGRDVLPTPANLTVEDITPVSATISWTPGNSNFQHYISLNDQEVRVVKPGTFQHTLTGLVPGRKYIISVMAKQLLANYDEKNKMKQEQLTANVDFETPTGGLPEPPLNFQVEAGPQEGTLLLTWLPVTINLSGISDGCLISGYVVYADGHWIKEANGPTNDHIILSPDDFQGFIPTELVLRTLAADRQESANSQPIQIPHSLISEITAQAAKAVATHSNTTFGQTKKSPQPSDGHDTDEEIESAFREVTKQNTGKITDVESESAPASASPVHTHSRIRTSPGMDASSQKSTNGRDSLSPRSSAISPSVVVPAIEITRDSSSERGNSFEISDEEKEGKIVAKGKPSEQSPDELNHSSPRSKVSDVKQRHSPMSQTDSSDKDCQDGKQRQSPVSPKYNSDTDGRDGYREVDDKSPNGKDVSQTPHEDTCSENRSKNKNTSSPRTKSPTQSASPRNRSEKHYDDQDFNANEPTSGDLLQNSVNSDLLGSEFLDYDEGGEMDSINGEINLSIDDDSIRLFVALFDYDPITMSPNADAIEEELPFKEGQIIKIIGDKDADGFYRGKINDSDGYVPCNMVSEIHVDDPDLAEQLLKESQENLHCQVSDKNNSLKVMNSQDHNHLTANGLPPSSKLEQRMTALYDYDPQELSPNVDAEVEIAFKAGDLVTVYGDIDDDGFYAGEINGVHGLVPSNFLQEAPLSDDISVVSLVRSENADVRSEESLSMPFSRLLENKLNQVGDCESFMHVAPPGGPGNVIH